MPQIRLIKQAGALGLKSQLEGAVQEGRGGSGLSTLDDPSNPQLKWLGEDEQVRAWPKTIPDADPRRNIS